jgi:small subunit ribosomal protein S2
VSTVTVQNLLEAGVHFGHRVSRWNPKMARYIFGKRNLIHIVNLEETLKGMVLAHHYVKKTLAAGKTALFVGTKRQAKSTVKQEAIQCGCPYVVERWVGGCLTNYETIRLRLKRLKDIEELETSGGFDQLAKKEGSRVRREKRKLLRNLEGIRTMDALPGVVIVIDAKRERIAVAEANKLGIPVVSLCDTDCDPDVVDIVIPGNDDSMRSIQILCRAMADAVRQGTAKREASMGVTRPRPAPAEGESAAKTDEASSAPTEAATEAPAEAPAEAAAPPAEEGTPAADPAGSAETDAEQTAPSTQA